jgi:hypothetical protein
MRRVERGEDKGGEKGRGKEERYPVVNHILCQIFNKIIL